MTTVSLGSSSPSTPSNPLSEQNLYDYGILRYLTPDDSLPPYFPQGYIFASPHDQAGPTAWRLFNAEYITEGLINPDRLGTGAVGDGNLFLADDQTWKPVVTKIIAGNNITISPTTGIGDVTINSAGIATSSDYGSFYSDQSQPILVPGTEQIVSLNNTYEADGISILNNRIYFSKAGTYQFSYVAQIFNLSNDIQDCEFWIKYNGVDFPNSATHITVDPRKSSGDPSEQQMTLVLTGTAQNDGDYIELYWVGSTVELELGYVPIGAGEPVASPSVIANIIPVGAIASGTGGGEGTTTTTPLTLQEVTDEGNVTTNNLTVGSLTSNGNVLINTTTDTGHTLNVQGTLRVSSSANIYSRLTVHGEQEFRQDGITNIITSRLGIFTLRGWATGRQAAHFNGWNYRAFIGSPLNVNSTSTTMTASLAVFGNVGGNSLITDNGKVFLR